jgi:hypothetical protein
MREKNVFFGRDSHARKEASRVEVALSTRNLTELFWPK